ncbi:hypothetical protein O0Q50_20750 [Priestia aryabhattai]|uniref:Uncharacterized protein n=1 Tax=Priestia aryabhattai TaxID=412384 RepID=A0AAX6NCT4_PRIAR|nr:hypothetical protein [Priestia aryabhattai]MDU9693607.1 hypothetical protein [Priestia aryabhattai]
MIESFESVTATFQSDGNGGSSFLIENPLPIFHSGVINFSKEKIVTRASFRHIFKNGEIVYWELSCKVEEYEFRFFCHHFAEFDILENNTIVTDRFFGKHNCYRDRKVICYTAEHAVSLYCQFVKMVSQTA